MSDPVSAIVAALKATAKVVTSKGFATAATATSIGLGVHGSRMQAKALERQAELAEAQAEQEAKKYKQQGIDALKGLEKINASIRARAAAGGVESFSGSALALQRFNETEAAQDQYIIEENRLITLAGGSAQSAQYALQGSAVQLGGYADAVAGIGKLGTTLRQTATPDNKVGSGQKVKP
jgi:hypothetical protein